MDWTVVLGVVGALLAGLKIFLEVAKLQDHEREWVAKKGLDVLTKLAAVGAVAYSIFVVYSYLRKGQQPATMMDVLTVLLHLFNLVVLPITFTFGYFNARHHVWINHLLAEVDTLKKRVAILEQPLKKIS
jgi:hypothetical protein